ncbi:MAG: YiiX/YebB-like N1pC/P60 family cysteine hydrolase [Desulforhopalus sp.]
MKTFFLLILLVSGCVARPAVERNDALHFQQSQAIKQQVMARAATGDWLVTRGYHGTDNLVANVTGLPISHVALFNAENKQVIEAEGEGVHYSTLDDFIAKSYRVIVIRPRWRSRFNGAMAWREAMRLVGSDYDFLGTIGFNFPSRYYCSELVVFAYRQWHSPKEKFPKVIKPGELYLYGEILYDSLPRDEI